MTSSIWLFGYGSILWRPNFDYVTACQATLPGFKRRFWQASSDHRGTILHPGAVVTLRPSPGDWVTGIAYRIEAPRQANSLAALDHREQNGYARFDVTVNTREYQQLSCLTYIVTSGNPWDLGEPSLNDLAQQIYSAAGPSGSNLQYFEQLWHASHVLDASDSHLEALASEILQIDKDSLCINGRDRLQDSVELLPWHPLRRDYREPNT